MISVLRSWSDVGNALGYLMDLGTDKNTRTYHTNPLKNWDLAQIARLLAHQKKNVRILDMGCGGSNVLRYCHRNKFANVYGIDLTINFQDRWQQLMYFKNNRFRIPYHLSTQSVTQTTFENNFFDILICLSVIEHNVNLEQFFIECSRLLKKGGKLYLSTDYWDKKINTSDAPGNYGLLENDWTIFSKKEIIEIIHIAKSERLILENKKIPDTNQPVVHWNTKKYTFLSIIFTKV